MKRFSARTYNFNSKLLLRSAMAFLLICFVLSKPLYAFTQTFSEDQAKYSCADTDERETDEKESDEKETEKEDLEEDDEKEDKLSLNHWNELSASSQNQVAIIEQLHASEFHLGVALPPPEIV
ncbi:MAG: hypothetical protein QNK23_06115 [Crocinitomicaceae bacterium]|nr:hypothetical protein [Crocinitomicaceae bacterium]